MRITFFLISILLYSYSAYSENQTLSSYQAALSSNISDKERSDILNNMGIIYESTLDYRNAFDAYRKAAIMGNPLAQYNLARMYGMGHGVIQDNKEAYAWASVAGAIGAENQADQDMIEEFIKRNSFILAAQQSLTKQPLIKEAKELANKYYGIYYLKLPENNSTDNGIRERLKAAYQAFIK